MSPAARDEADEFSWEVCKHVKDSVTCTSFPTEREARQSFRRSFTSSVLFGPDGHALDQKYGMTLGFRDSASKQGLEDIFRDRSWRQGELEGGRRWLLGTSINFTLRWRSFSSEEAAVESFQQGWWSKILFDPDNHVMKCSTGTFDRGGSGVAALLTAWRARQTTARKTGNFLLHYVKTEEQVQKAMDSGDAPFIPQDRGPLLRRALQYAWEKIATRSVVSALWLDTSLCFFDAAKSPAVKGYVALTIDDAPCRLGPQNSMMRDVVALLKKYDAAATFMVMGRFVKSNEEDLAEALRAGHELGNHCLVDRPYHWDSSEDLHAAIEECSEQIRKVQRLAGVEPVVRWFRAPHGLYSDTMAQVINKLGLTNVMCDTYACCPVLHDSRFIGRFLANQCTDGSIIVIHMPERGFRDWCYDGLEICLERLKARGLRVVTVGELAERAEWSLGDPAPTPLQTTIRTRSSILSGSH